MSSLGGPAAVPDPVVRTQTWRKQGRPHPHTTVNPSCRRGEAPPPERPQLDGFTDIQIAHLTRQTPIPPPVQSLTSNKGMQCTRIQFGNPANNRSHNHHHLATTTPKQRPYQNPRSHTTATPLPATPNTRQTTLEFWLGQLQTHKPQDAHAAPCHATLLSLSPATPTTPNINQVGEKRSHHLDPLFPELYLPFSLSPPEGYRIRVSKCRAVRFMDSA